MAVIPQLDIESYYEFLQEEEKSRNTIGKYMRDVKAFAKWITDKPLCKSTVLEYKEYMLIHGYSPSSVNSVLCSLNSFFSFVNLQHLKVKLLKIQQQIFANEKKELTKAEYERLLNAARAKGNEQLYLLMQTICATGIRVSELMFITVESVKKGKALINLKGKLRVVIIPHGLCKKLLKFTKKRGITKGSIFVTRTGNPLDRSNIWKMMRSLCKSAGVSREKVFPHNLRHLFARTFYSLQKDIVRLADVLGHSSINTTRVYTVETGEVHRKQIQSLGLVRFG